MTPAMPIPARIVALVQERNRLFGYSRNRLAAAIHATGFRCSRCGRCCTRAVNSHIFLLEQDVESLRVIDPEALVPAPDPEFCDQDGNLYVSGYAVRMKGDGSCRFLDGTSCRIYDRRFLACRTFPYMLRRATAPSGTVAWRHFSGLHDPAFCRADLSEDECFALAQAVLEYENAFLTQQIAFLETVHTYFVIHGLCHDPALHALKLRKYSSGVPARVLVYHDGELLEWQGGTPGPAGAHGEPGDTCTAG